MSAKLRKFKKEWLQESWAQGWLVDVSDDDHSFQDAYCKLCRKYLRAHKTDLEKHGSTSQHKKKMNFFYPVKQQTMLNNIVVINDEQKEKELLLTLNVTMHSAVRSIDHLSEMINRMFPNSLRIHRTKCSYIIKNVLAPSLLTEIIEDMGNQNFSIILDESTDISITKYLCICVRYYSEGNKRIFNRFIGLIEVEKSTSDMLYTALKEYLLKLKLKIENIVGLGTDGGSNLCGCNNSVYTLLKKDNPKVKLIRCICHFLDNINSAAAKVLPNHLDFMCSQIYSWFSVSSVRQNEYRNLFNTFNSNKVDRKFHKFVKLSTTRWLCRYNVIRVIIEQYDELKVYFSTVVSAEKCYTSKTLNNMLQDPQNYLYFVLLKPILYEINKLNIIFQKDFVELGKTYDDIISLIMFLAMKIYKQSFSSNIKDVINNISNELAFLAAEKANFGIDFDIAVKNMKIKPEDLSSIKIRAKDYIYTLLKLLIDRLSTSIYHFKNLKAISPSICLSQTLRMKFADLPFLHDYVIESRLSVLENEYNLLISVNWADYYGTDVFNSTYTFWTTVFYHENAGGTRLFSNLASFAITLLSLPTSNAVVERVFSVMNATKNKLRNKMHLSMLNSLLLIKLKLHSENKCCIDVSVTKDMYLRFNQSMYDFKNILHSEQSEVDELFDDAPVMEIINDFNVPCISLL